MPYRICGRPEEKQTGETTKNLDQCGDPVAGGVPLQQGGSALDHAAVYGRGKNTGESWIAP